MTSTGAQRQDEELSPAARMFIDDRVRQSLGIVRDEAGPGRARLRLRMSEQMVNGHGIAHGGYLFLLADAAFAYASNTRGAVALAQSAQITYLQPAVAGEELL